MRLTVTLADGTETVFTIYEEVYGQTLNALLKVGATVIKVSHIY